MARKRKFTRLFPALASGAFLLGAIFVPSLTLAAEVPPSLPVSVSAASVASSAASTVASSARSKVRTAASLEDIITCELYLDLPHQSTHNPANANVIGGDECTQLMDELYLTVGLYYNATSTNDMALVARTYWQDADEAGISGNAAAPCRSGYYMGGVLATEYFPAGYEPSPQDAGPFYGSPVYVTCS